MRVVHILLTNFTVLFLHTHLDIKLPYSQIYVDVYIQIEEGTYIAEEAVVRPPHIDLLNITAQIQAMVMCSFL